MRADFSRNLDAIFQIAFMIFRNCPVAQIQLCYFRGSSHLDGIVNDGITKSVLRSSFFFAFGTPTILRLSAFV